MIKSLEINSQSTQSNVAEGKGGAAAASAGRTTDGRFTKNNKGGPGNPFNRQMAAYRQAVLDGVTPADFAEIVAVVLIKAKSGDLAAIKLLFSYAIGKPGPVVDPDTLDQQEWEMYQRAAVPAQQVDELMTSVPAATANAAAQIVWPCAAQQHMQPVVQGLRAAEAAAGAVPAPASSTQEQAGTAAGPSAAQPPNDQAELPSPNRGIGDDGRPRPAEPTPKRSSRPVIPRPANLPPNIDWEYEQRIHGILFGDDAPSDDKPG